MMAPDPFPGLRRDVLPPAGRLRAWMWEHRGWVVAIEAVLLLSLLGSLGPVGAGVLAVMLAVTEVGVPSGTEGASMVPTLGLRTRGLLLRFPPFRARRGDVVVALLPGRRPIAKRVAAVGGDTVRFAGGRVWVDDRPLPLPADLSQDDPDTHQVEVVVPDGTVFLLGDGLDSIDSRHLGAVPVQFLVGRYVALWNRRPPPADLHPDDREDVEALRAAGAPAVASLDAALAAGPVLRPHLWMMLRWGWRQVGDDDRLVALLVRARRGVWSVPEDRAWFTVRLVQARMHTGDDEAALTAVDEVLRLGISTRHDPTLRSFRAALLARLERYEDALAAAEQVDSAAARVSALVGLGRLEEARAAVDAVSDWGGPCWESYYRAYLAVADGDLGEAAQRVQEAVEAGFPDRRLIGRTSHLQALRVSPHWDPTWALPEA